MEGKDGVPLRFPRPVMALIATGMAATSIGLCAMPASADQVRTGEWWLSSLGINAAWAASQGSGVTVAVLSDGVDASHADLAGAVTAAPAPVGAPVASGQYLGEQGTPIASLIAGRGHGPGGTAGIIGVAPQARILSVPVTLPADDPQLAELSVAAAIPGAIAAGIRYAVQHGATVIDLPIDPGQAGSTGTGAATAAAGGSTVEQAAISYALAHNVVLVAPAGDDETVGDAPNYPAAYHGVIAVGAFDSAFNKAAWSSHQNYVTLTAAGAGVPAADSVGSYETMNSTSAASAVVTGVVALIRSRYPNLTVADIRQALITTTMYHRADGLADGSGYGAVNADHAMIAAAALATPPSPRASAQAQPRQAPVAVPRPAAAQGMGSQILRAGEISGGLLILLLLLIAVYAATGRRRSRNKPAVAAEWAHRQAPSRYPHAVGADADRMLELFAAPAAAPAPTAALMAPAPPRELYPAQAASDGWPGRDDEGVFGPAGRESSCAPAQQPAGPPIGPPAPSVAAADAGGWQTHGPASRAVSRRPSVSGAPPWEPAAAPDSELPWTAGPGRHAGAASTASGASGASAASGASVGPDSVGPGRDTFARLARTGGVASSGPSQPGLHPPGAHVGPGQSGAGRIASPAHSHHAPAAHAADLDYEPSDWADQLGREPTASGVSSPAGASPPGGYRFSADSGDPDAAEAAGHRSPTGSGAPAGFGSHAGLGPRLGYGSPAGYNSDAGAGAGSDLGYRGDGAGASDQGREADALPGPAVAPSGLPVRQPRASRPVSPAALSPSGSLWEPASRDVSEPAGYQDESQEAARPIFVWNPATSGQSRPTTSGE
jgi:hypothetical protein